MDSTKTIKDLQQMRDEGHLSDALLKALLLVILRLQQFLRQCL